MGWDGMSNLNYYCLSDEFLLQKDKRKKMMGLSCPSPDCSSSSPRYNLFSLFTFLLPKGFIFLVLMRMGFGYRNSEKQSVIVASPSRFSCYSEPFVSIEKRLLTHKDSHCNVMPKSSEDLRKEIASLEFEILRTEQYLLSLYRTAFDEQVTSSYSPHTETSLVSNQFCPISEQSDLAGVLSYHYQASPVSERSSSCPKSFQASLKAFSAREKTRYVSGNHTTLGDLLGSSHIVDDTVNPSRLSEEILRCISSVYVTLSTKAKTSSSCLPPSPSPSSYVSWNPCLGEIKEADVPRGVVIESLKLHLDDSSFNHAALMLQNFRSLVQKLEKVDPSRLKREEKLAFWINIHNALTMHVSKHLMDKASIFLLILSFLQAYLAYGTNNRARNNSVLKAAYDVGGYRVNPHIIQSSILGLRPHFTPPLLQTLFSPSRKSKTCTVKHIYALDYPEALAHFALSSGASTDPHVRVYKADCVFRDLRRAKEEFIRDNVRIQNETKIVLPKIVHYYAKDMSLDASALMETTVRCLPDSMKRVAQKLLKKKSKCIEFSPENLSFRYVIISRH
ncbi:uncharacterized protein LOC106347303 isoform X1 [Brassica napus]|uniref:uncharacterized protein LOC106347303 isoform X1 n=1 Tax=Brassica napus TaxID=3708 RepID=UPI00207875C1|nr:uncharacterized protein LOC106347303 isoform X1 [Brassica napus]